MSRCGLHRVASDGTRPFSMSAILRAVRHCRRQVRPRGEVAEWSNAPDSKSGIRVSRIEGSNPSLSAIRRRRTDDPDGAAATRSSTPRTSTPRTHRGTRAATRRPAAAIVSADSGARGRAALPRSPACQSGRQSGPRVLHGPGRTRRSTMRTLDDRSSPRPGGRARLPLPGAGGAVRTRDTLGMRSESAVSGSDVRVHGPGRCDGGERGIRTLDTR